MTRPLHGRRARRAQWIADAEALNRCAGFLGYAAAILRDRSAAKRERRLAARRAA